MKFLKGITFLICCFIVINTTNAQRNPNNPYDIIGEQHNTALDLFFTEQTSQTIGRQLTIETLVGYLCNKLTVIDCKSIRQSLGGQLFLDIKDKSLMESESMLIEHGYVSARHGFYVQQINDIIEQHMQEEYSICYRAILVLEDQLVNDPQLSSYEKTNLLYSTSVARYSTKFWKDVQSGIVRYPSIASQVGNLLCCSWVSTMGRSDVKGAVAGGVAAGGAGAVAGGAGASIGSAVSSFWNSIF